MPLESGRGIPLRDAEEQASAITMVDGVVTITVQIFGDAFVFLEPDSFARRDEILARHRERIEQAASRKYGRQGAENGVLTIEAKDLKEEDSGCLS